MNKATELGIDVIITDHHKPDEKLPGAYAIINPKAEDLYPFYDLAGVGVVYKLVFALFFSYTKYYNKEMIILDIETTGLERTDEIIEIGAIKLRNLINIEEFHEYVKPNGILTEEIKKITSITDEQLSLARDTKDVINDFSSFIKDGILVGHNIANFDLLYLNDYMNKYLGHDIKNEIIDTLELSQTHLKLEKNNLESVSKFFKIEVDGTLRHNALYDAKVTAEIFKKFFKITKKIKEILDLFSEYAVLGTLADVVPLTGENRLIVKKGLEKLNNTDIIGFELLVKKLIDLKRLNINGKKLNSKALSWKIIPILNAAGRMGMAEKALKLLITEDKTEAEKIVDELIQINEQRKGKQELNFSKIMDILEEKVDIINDKIFVIDVENMEHGVTGVIANRIKDMFYRPVVIVIMEDKAGVGTARSIEQFKIFDAFKKCEDLLIQFGGHPYAVGFSINLKNVELFKKRIKAIADQELQDKDLIPALDIDAEISIACLNPEFD